MELLPQATAAAAQISDINRETIGFLRSQAKRAFDLVNTEGKQQAVLDVLGANAAKALTVYATIRGALESLGEAEGVPEADLSVFVPAADGSVQYVAPVIEEEPEANPQDA